MAIIFKNFENGYFNQLGHPSSKMHKTYYSFSLLTVSVLVFSNYIHFFFFNKKPYANKKYEIKNEK